MPTRSAAERLGTVLAETYELKSILGKGGMGVVYEAEHGWTRRRVAVKVIVWDGTGAPGAQRALNEARLATRLRHPNVVDVLDMGEDEPGVIYLAMEYLEGQPLSELIKERGRLDPAVTLELILPILGAVAVAHDAEILHRDLKPSNLFVSKGPRGEWLPKLLDFGIAKVSGQDTLTKTGAVVGTPHYMAPEQATDGVSTPSSDSWALGVVLHECLRGERPYDGGSSAAVLLKIVNTRAPRLHEAAPWVPKALAAVVDRSLERDFKCRFSDTRELARALLAAALQDGVAVPDDPDPIGLPAWRQWRAEIESSNTASTELASRRPSDPNARVDGTTTVDSSGGLTSERSSSLGRLASARRVAPLVVVAVLATGGAVWWLSERPLEAPTLRAAPSAAPPATLGPSAPAANQETPARAPRVTAPAPIPLDQNAGAGRVTRKPGEGSSQKPPHWRAQPVLSREPARPKVPASGASSAAPASAPPPQAPASASIPELMREW
jgi:serine/threonine-protein kinase